MYLDEQNECFIAQTVLELQRRRDPQRVSHNGSHRVAERWQHFLRCLSLQQVFVQNVRVPGAQFLFDGNRVYW